MPTMTQREEPAETAAGTWDLNDAVRPEITADRPFELVTEFDPRGSQPEAIESLTAGVRAGEPHQVLLGITGSGKTFTMANVIANVQRPALVLVHNKTLAAQLYAEFKALFPHNRVEYFVSYYDYYQPEAYVPSTDTFIEKDSNINEQIDRMRHAATYALLSRRDVIIVASVSCIFGIGAAEAYYGMVVPITVGQTLDRDALLRRLVEVQYERNDVDFHRGTFRARGDVVEIFPPYEDSTAVRVEFFGDEVDSIVEIDALRGTSHGQMSRVTIFPASHYVTPQEQLRRAIAGIRDELGERLPQFRANERLLEAQRLEQRTMFDLEMLEEMGRCAGVENYSRHLTGRRAGEPPPTLVDYFADDFLVFIDESHQTVPQIRAMYKGDRSRKETLVEHGFRLPSALDNRPLRFEEWETRAKQTIYVSATPGNYELEKTHGEVIQQLIRPTGLLDPEIEIRPIAGQVDDLFDEIKGVVALNERVLVTTLTKRMAEDLTEYFVELGVRVRYLHADVDTLERIEILRDLRAGVFDVLVGINLLREGLDLPEVRLVAILDADKEGFLRERKSLFQTCGRAARNVAGRVIMYADRVTASMDEVIRETERRRALQQAFNEAHGIVPMSTTATVNPIEVDKEGAPGQRPDRGASVGDPVASMPVGVVEAPLSSLTLSELDARIAALTETMRGHAVALRFEDAATCRDQIRVMEARRLALAP